MFLVQDEHGIFQVYGVKDNEGVIEFLLYDTNGWVWSEARHYEPYLANNERNVEDGN